MAPEIEIEVAGPGVKGRAKATVRADRTLLWVAGIVGGTVLVAVLILAVVTLVIALSG